MACIALLGGSVLIASVAAAEPSSGQARVRVTHLGAPVYNAPLELIDLRSGEVVSTANTGDDGVAIFEEVPPDILFEAQTPNGKFTSPPFRAGGSVKLALATDGSPPATWGVAASGTFIFGDSGVDASTLRSAMGPPISTPISSAFSGPAAGLHIYGPTLTSARIRPYVSGHFWFPVDKSSAKILRGNFQDQRSSIFDWEPGSRWGIAAGIETPIPLTGVESSIEVDIGFARQEVDFKGTDVCPPGLCGSTPPPPIQFTNDPDDEIDYVTVRLGLPVRVWRHGGMSAHVYFGMGADFPVGGRNEVVEFESEFQPGTVISGFVGLRFRFDHFPLPSVR